MGSVISRRWGGGRLRRAVSTCLAVTLGASAAVALSAAPASAAGGSPSIDSSPTGATTATPLAWTFSNPPLGVCELDGPGGATISAPAICTSPTAFDVSTDDPGDYTLTVYATTDPTDLTAPSATDTVTVALQPKFTSKPSSPSSNPTPSWSFALPNSATATCELDGPAPASTAVDGPGACGSSYSPPALTDPGVYTLTVTPTDGGAVGETATDTYDFEPGSGPTGPVAPTVTADASVGSSLNPTFTVTGLDPADSPDCKVSPATGVSISGCNAPSSPGPVTVTVTLPASGNGTTYTLTVTQSDGTTTSDPGSDTYRLDTDTPDTPTIVADPSDVPNPPGPAFGQDTSPRFDVANLDQGTKLECSVKPATVTITTCDPTTAISPSDPDTGTVVLDLTGADVGTYTVTVDAKNVAGTKSDDASASYEYLPTAPPAPTVTQLTPTATPGQPAFKDPAPTFTVSDTEDVTLTYKCALTGPASGSVATCGATTTLDLTKDGAYGLTVKVIDELGQASVFSDPVSYTLDTSTPTPMVKLKGDTSPSNNATPTYTITDSENSQTPADGPDTFNCVWVGPDGTTISSGMCVSGDSFDADAGDGTYTLTVTATDLATNTATADPVSYELETGSPPAPTITPASSFGQSPDVSFAVTDTDTVDLTYTCHISAAASTVSQSVITDCGPTTTIALGPSAPEDLYTLSVKVSDGLDPPSAPGRATYRLDQSTPVPSVQLAPPDVSPSANTAPMFLISDVLEIDQPETYLCTWTAPDGTASTSACTSPATFNTSVNPDGTNLDGTYTLSVIATDAALNTNPTPGVATYELDSTSPTSPIVTLVNPAKSPGNQTHVTFSVTNPGDQSPGGLTYSCAVTGVAASGGATVTLPAADITCGATTLVDLSSSPDGDYTLSVTAADQADNPESAPGTAMYSLDTTAPATPTLALTLPPSSPNSATQLQFSVSNPGDVSPGGLTYACSMTGVVADGGATVTVPAADVVCGTITTVDLGSSPDGVYTLAVTATDQAANSSAAPGAATYDLDTTAPAAPTVTLTTPTKTPNNVTHLTFSVANPGDLSPGGLTYTCAMMMAASSEAPAVTVPATDITCGATTSVNLSSSPDGDYTLSVTAADEALNQSATPGTATYVLDTLAPAPPIVELASATRSNTTTPLWTWHFGLSDPSTSSDSATCIVFGPNSWTSTTPNCAHHFITDLGGGDGIYSLSVVLTDEAGNVAIARSPAYRLDSTAPPGPTVFLKTPSSGDGLDRHPVWSVTGPPNSILMCTLLQGGHDGDVVVPERVCPDPATFSLVGLRDGEVSLKVVAIDPAHNRSFPAWSSYVLSPAAPSVTPPHGQSATAVWTVNGNTRDSFVCTLTHAGVAVERPQSCGHHPTYEMSQRVAGTYTLSVVQVGAEDARSDPGTASWFWRGLSPVLPPVGGGHHPGSGIPPSITKPKPPKNPTPLSRIPPVVRKQFSKLTHAVGGTSVTTIIRHVQPNRISDDVTSAVQGVVHAVGSAGAGTGFPLLLVGLVLAFLIAQNRIDRRDPKLALASIAADDMVNFQPPPSRRGIDRAGQHPALE
jgi:hypothetical protein